MASVLYGNGVSRLSGSIAGTTFTSNGIAMGKPRDRIKVKKVQVGDRSAPTVFTQATQKWRTLTDAERRAWQVAAEHPTKGYWYFLRLNMRRLNNQLSLPILRTPPELQTLPSTAIIGTAPMEGLTPLYINAETEEGTIFDFSVFFEAVQVVTADLFTVFATRWVSPGVKYMNKSEFVYITSSHVIDGNIIQFKDEYRQRFGYMAPGSRVFVEVRMLNQDSGQTIVLGRVSGIVSGN